MKSFLSHTWTEFFQEPFYAIKRNGKLKLLLTSSNFTNSNVSIELNSLFSSFCLEWFCKGKSPPYNILTKRLTYDIFLPFYWTLNDVHYRFWNNSWYTSRLILGRTCNMCDVCTYIWITKKYDILCNEKTLNINVRKIVIIILSICISKKSMKTKICTYEILVFILFISHAFCVYNMYTCIICLPLHFFKLCAYIHKL